MKCTIILDDKSRGWIIEKMAVRLQMALRELGVEVDLLPRWSANSDINHFMHYLYADASCATKNTMFITHVDDPTKFMIIKDMIENVDMGICMSQMSVNQLVEAGIPRECLCYISPAHDGLVKPRRIRIGITSNLYDDGRKRESLLAKLAAENDLSEFEFEIFGQGWQRMAECLRASGASVTLRAGTNDYQGDYETILRRIPEFDYYLYTGLDEGSLGTLDALAAGIPTITTPQGFHLDVPDCITYPFVSYRELRNAFDEIAKERRRRTASVAGLTWLEYARKHLQVWGALLNKSRADIPRILRQEVFTHTYAPRTLQKRNTIGRIADYTKLTNRYRWKMFKQYYAPKLRRRLKRWLGKTIVSKPV
jgi:hypothetical protein